MAQYTVNDLMTQQAPQIGPMINQKIMARPTPWITLGKKEVWSDEVSSKQKTMQFDRAMLVDSVNFPSNPELVEEVEWADVAGDVALNDLQANHIGQTGVNGDGLPPADTVSFSQTLRDYRLQHKAVWGPTMNTNNLRDKFQRVKQMSACTDALADQGRELQIARNKSEYVRNSDKLVILDSSFSLAPSCYNSVTFPGYSGTDASILTNEFTDIIYEYLNHQGAGVGALGEAGGSSSYSLITSPRSSRRLIMADPERREDFRYSSQNEYLLKAMGQKVSYNGFAHTNDEKNNRWEFCPNTAGTTTVTYTNSTGLTVFSAAPLDQNGVAVRLYKGSTIVVKNGGGTVIGKLVVIRQSLTANNYICRWDDPTITAGNLTATAVWTAWAAVPQFLVIPVTVGGVTEKKKLPNQAWLTATWEDTTFYHQGVCTTLVPKPITSVGQASFPAVNYAGSYRWTVYDDKDFNPDGSIGQFRGVWSSGTRPDSPEFGVICRHLAVPFPDGRIIDGSSLG